MTPGDGVEDPPRRSAVRRTLQWVLLTVAAVVVLAGVWISIDVLRVRSALDDAQRQTDELTRQLEISGPGGENGIAGQLARDVAHARSITRGRAWALGRHLPLVGGDFKVVAEATDALSGVAKDGVPALTQLAADRDDGSLGLTDGRIDLSVLSRLTPVVVDSDAVFTQGRSRFDAIDLSQAHGFVSRHLADVRSKLAQAQALLHTGSIALKLAPDMLGEHGPRTYLLVFQNNAELRATGGIPGAYAELRVDDGRLHIGRQGSGAATGVFDPPAVRPATGEDNRYGTLPATYWNDANLGPDFPETAKILRAMYKIRFHTDLDGIVSVDPVALAHVLAATGPVKVRKNIVLDSGSVVPILLNAVYTHYPNDDPAQNAFFADAARTIFKAFVTGGDDPAALLRELSTAVGENRILVNATAPAEQALLSGTRLAGDLPVGPSSHPNLGLYVNDTTAAKLEFYLSRRTVVSSVSCDSQGAQTLLTNTILDSLAPKNVVSLGSSVVGYGAGAKRGEMFLDLSFYAPYGGKVTRVAIDGVDRSVNYVSDHGLEVATVPVSLLPGHQHTVTTTIVSGPGQRGDTVFRTTPGVQPTPNDVKIASSCR